MRLKQSNKVAQYKSKTMNLKLRIRLRWVAILAKIGTANNLFSMSL